MKALFWHARLTELFFATVPDAVTRAILIKVQLYRPGIQMPYGIRAGHSSRRVFLIAVVGLLACGSALSAEQVDAPGIQNFAKVNDHIFRGAQPSEEGFKSLANLGVKTVINLREGSENASSEKGLVEAAGMRYVSVPMKGFSAPTDEQVWRVLSELETSPNWPVFVHCRRGADRTGTVIACYRIAHESWSNDKALAEAREHGMSRFERGMRGYVLHFRPTPTRASANDDSSRQ